LTTTEESPNAYVDSLESGWLKSGGPMDAGGTCGSPFDRLLHTKTRSDDPHKLVFFEVFSSAAAHQFHLEQDHTKRMFASLDDKVFGVPTLTKLSAL